MNTTDLLPPLPTPDLGMPWRVNAPDGSAHSAGYTADQMQAYAAQAVETLRSQLAHWKTFAIHAEVEHAAWKKTATELDAELRALRDPAPLVAWITEGGCECLQRGEGPVRVMPEEDQETGFTVPLYARERPAQQKDCRECAMQPCDTCPDVPGADALRASLAQAIAQRERARRLIEGMFWTPRVDGRWDETDVAHAEGFNKAKSAALAALGA